MHEARHEVTVRRPASEVFGFLADGLNGPKWRTGYSATSPTSPGPASVRRTSRASRVRAVGDRCRLQCITTYEPDSRLGFEVMPGPVRPIGEYVLDEVEGGNPPDLCAARGVGRTKKLLLGGAVQQTMDAEVEATERLKSLLESMPVG